MKLYKFYYKADISGICVNIDNNKSKSTDDYIKHKYPLYAFTNNKKIFKEFKLERNMDSFIIIKSDIDDEDYEEYAKANRDALLDIVILKTLDDNNKICDLEFAITSYEQIVIDDLSIEYLMPDEFVPYLIFNKEIVKALKTLEYPFFESAYGGMVLEEDYDDYNQPEIATNEFEILYSQFSGTF